MYRFILSAAVLAFGIPMLSTWLYGQGWLPVLPSFLYESTWLVAFVTTILFVYLHRQGKPSVFVQLYLLSMAIKLLACFAFSLLMILEDRTGAVANVLYFLIIYILFTGVEVAFLYRRISRSTRS